MKALFLCVLLSLVSTAAFAQKHMVEFSPASLLLGQVDFSESKERFNQNSEEFKSAYLYVNYAYAVTSHLQLGTRLTYFKYEGGGSEGDSKGLALGAIFNLDEDMRNSLYLSLFGGMDWTKSETNGFGTDKEEEINGTVAVGKRFPLSFINLENVTYSPEVSFTSKNSTKSNAFTEWEQDFKITYLQFAVFF